MHLAKSSSTTIAALALICCGAVWSQPVSSPDLTLKDRAYIAARTYSSVNIYFAHWAGVPHLSYETAAKSYMELALPLDQRRDFVLRTLEFLTLLRNGQTTLTDTWLTETHGQPLGFDLESRDGTWFVGASLRPDLKPGDVIKAIDNEDTAVFCADKERFIPASSPREGRTRLQSMPYLFPQKFVLTLADGRKVTVDRSRKVSPPPVQMEARWIEPGKIAYMKLPAFSTELEQAALAKLKEFFESTNLILDLRGNASGPVPLALTKAVMTGPYRGWSEMSPMSVGIINSHAQFGATPQLFWTNRVGPPELPGKYLGQIIILTDGRCSAACEDFIEPFKDSKRAILVGETTMGSSGEVFTVDFRNGIKVTVGTKREFFPDGSAFEGVGINPDFEVPLRIEDIRSGKDAALQKARDIASGT